MDKTLKHLDDHPTLGLLLCQQADHMVVEYALSTIHNPVGVAQYRTVTEELPKEYESLLPSPQQFQHLLNQAKQKK